MQTTAIKPAPARRKVLTAGIVLALLGIPLALYWLRPEPEPESASPPLSQVRVPAAAPRFGPGVLSASASSPSKASEFDSGAPVGITAAQDQHLVINRELRNTFDYFLLEGNALERATRVARLQQYLKAKLPATANEEATKLAATYLNYLDAFQKLTSVDSRIPKTASPSSPPNAEDIERFNVKMEQIAKLRRDMFGEQTARLWFAEDQEVMQQSVIEMRQAYRDFQEKSRQ